MPSKALARPSRSSTRLRIILVGVGEDELAPRQPVERRDQSRIGGEPGEIDVVDEIEKVVRIDAVLGHQPGERGAVSVEIALLNAPRLDRVDVRAGAGYIRPS